MQLKIHSRNTSHSESFPHGHDISVIQFVFKPFQYQSGSWSLCEAPMKERHHPQSSSIGKSAAEPRRYIRMRLETLCKDVVGRQKKFSERRNAV